MSSQVPSPDRMGVSREGPGLAGEEEGQMVMRGLSLGWAPCTILPVYSPCPCPLGSWRSQGLGCKGQSAPLQSIPHFRAVPFATENSFRGKKPPQTANLQQSFIKQEAPGSLPRCRSGAGQGRRRERGGSQGDAWPFLRPQRPPAAVSR